MSKIHVVGGDLTLSSMGLGHEEYEKLSHSVDSVIHLAADLNLVNIYGKETQSTEFSNLVRTTNVKGTLNMLEFSTTGKTKYFFHASSIICNFKLAEDYSLSETWPGENDFVDVPLIAYPISKYVSERHLAVAAEERGLPIKVFR